MSRREPIALKSLLPSLLGRLAREGGPVASLAPLWEEVVGESIARQAHPRRMEGTLLIIGVSSAVWARELAGRERELLKSLAERLPSLPLTGLQFELA